MKKKIIGIAVAALLFGSSIGYAANSSLIGAKVTGLFTLQYTDKTKIADAVIINGSAYIPVRKMAEATGSELTVEGKTITLESTVETSQAIGETTQVEPVDIQAERERLRVAIEKKSAGITEFKKSQIDFYDALITENPNSTTIPQWKAAKEKYTVVLEQLNAELTLLQAQLTEIDAKIAAQ